MTKSIPTLPLNDSHPIPQLGFSVVLTPSRIEENIAVFDFALSAEQMQRIASLDSGSRIGPDPATFVRP